MPTETDPISTSLALAAAVEGYARDRYLNACTRWIIGCDTGVSDTTRHELADETDRADRAHREALEALARARAAAEMAEDKF